MDKYRVTVNFKTLVDAIAFAKDQELKQGREPDYLILSRPASMRLVFELSTYKSLVNTIAHAPEEFLGRPLVITKSNAEDYFEFGYRVRD